MHSENFQLENRSGLVIRGEVLHPAAPRGLAFFHHGLSGQRRQPHMQTMAAVAVKHGLISVTFDGTNSFGESEGKLIDATPTQHIHDLEDVIDWAAGQPFYREPFFLLGHSLGGLSTLHFAQQHPEKVCGLAPTAAVIGGADWHNAYMTEAPEYYRAWQKEGSVKKTSSLDPARSGEISWNLMEDARQYDMLEKAHLLTMPVLLIVSSEDRITRQIAQKNLQERLPGSCRLHVIDGSEHTFKDAHLDSLRTIVDQWLSEVLTDKE